MKILITGGAGFIGSNLATSLVARGHTVTVLDNLSPQIHGEKSRFLAEIGDQFQFLRGDVRNRADWVAALEGQDVVVHLAAETGTGQSMYEIERYIDVNVRGTALLLDLLANQTHNVRKLVVASSRSVYGEGRYHCFTHGTVYPGARLSADMERGDFHAKCPYCQTNVELRATTEDSLINPTSIYGITKHSQEQMILTVGASLSIPAVALRYQNVYGPGQSLANPYTGILSIFSTRIKNGNEIIIFEDGEEGRDFVFIDDVVDATVASIELSDSRQHVVNVGSGVRTSVLDVAHALLSAYGEKTRLRISGNFRLGDIRDNYADITKARQLLAFNPKIDFSTGIHRFARWVENQSINVDTYESSISEMRSKGLFK
jgi:dTDP-L-rhamnose 4-epimerase